MSDTWLLSNLKFSRLVRLDTDEMSDTWLLANSKDPRLVRLDTDEMSDTWLCLIPGYRETSNSLGWSGWTRPKCLIPGCW